MEAGPLARLVQLADIEPADSVLDIGSASGYSAAILGRLARIVVALEADEALAAKARETLAAQGADNVTVVTGPLEAGHAAGAPYDVIVIEGAVEFIPDSILGQLAEGGRIVAVMGSNGLAAKAMLYTRSEGATSGRPVFNTHVRPLPAFARPRSFVF
jgi:protein-L-isoaspartate(D-aspartate) O-methyltransferase